jgi:hypothetical protein
VGELRDGAEGAGGGDRSAACPGGERDHGVLGQVGRVDGQHVAGAEAARREAACRPLDERGELAVGEGAAARRVDERRLAGEAIGMAQHVLGEPHVGQLGVGPGAASDVLHGEFDRHTRRDASWARPSPA